MPMRFTPVSYTHLDVYKRQGETENFTDATVGGSTIDVKGAFTYVSWNADESGKKYIVCLLYTSPY